MSMFKTAGKAEIIRSQQKDEYYISYLKSLAADVVHCVFGPRVWISWRKELEIAADLGYFCLTTLSGFQTIGEEYVNIVQVDQSKRNIPSALRRCFMVFIHVLVPYILRKFLDWLEKKLKSQDSQEVPMATRQFLLQCIPVMRTMVVYGHRLHMAVFYLRGIFYHIAKRLSGVHYLQYTGGRPSLDDNTVSQSFTTLGWITLSQLTGSSLIGLYKYIKDRTKHSRLINEEEQSDSNESYVSPDRKCSLCLEERKFSTVTPCGHLYCWHCIHDWCSTKQECPICREKFEPHRIVYLQNLDPP
ncbi:peroxisome biogenesis factor 10 [Mactra antiquata]